MKQRDSSERGCEIHCCKLSEGLQWGMDLTESKGVSHQSVCLSVCPLVRTISGGTASDLNRHYWLFLRAIMWASFMLINWLVETLHPLSTNRYRSILSTSVRSWITEMQGMTVPGNVSHQVRHWWLIIKAKNGGRHPFYGMRPAFHFYMISRRW